MKKFSRRLLSFLLVLTLLVGMFPALAANKSKTKTNINYVALGDSIATGVGLSDNPATALLGERTEETLGRHSEYAYPELLVNALKIKPQNFHNVSYAAMRAEDLRDCLDDSFTANTEDYIFMTNALAGIKAKNDFQTLVKNADLITLDIGANDIATQSMIPILFQLQDASKENTSVPFPESLSNLTADSASAVLSGSILYDLLMYAKDINQYSETIESLIRTIGQNYSKGIKHWKAVVDRIYELNPDVTLVVLGVYNPYRELTYSDTSLLKLGASLDSIVALYNRTVKNYGATKDSYIYVDITDAESLAMEQHRTITDPDYFNAMLADVHPSADGQKYITACIQDKLSSAGVITLSPVTELLLRALLKILSLSKIK